MAGIDGNCYAGICFDLFGTLVFFDKEKLRGDGAEASVAARTARYLAPLLERYFPQVAVDDFAAGLEGARAELRQEAGEELYEYPCEERFRRALLLAGAGRERSASEGVTALVSGHMQNLASAAFLPERYRRLLGALAGRFRLALVSNFDHSATARGILKREAIGELFSTVVISADVGRRKPHPLMFQRALADLGVEASRAMHVGDTLLEDIAGAQKVGITAVWVNNRGERAIGFSPDLVVPDIEALASLLD